MALSDSNNVTKRIDVNRRLTFGEMDENFEQLKLVITDAGNLEVQLGNKVSQTVYDSKIADVDQSILDLENALIGTVSEEFVNQLESRIAVNEDGILTLQGDLDALINDTATALDSTWSSQKISGEIDVINTSVNDLETDVGTNQTNISSLQTNKRDTSDTSFPRYDLGHKYTTGLCDFSLSNSFGLYMNTYNRSVSFANVPSDRAFCAVVTLYSILSGGSITWPANINWAGGEAPVIEGSWMIITLLHSNNVWYGSVGAQG